jgi:hypothetical protein
MEKRKAPSGDTLPANVQTQLRRELAQRDADELGQACGVSGFTITRAAAGQRVMRASGVAIVAGLERLGCAL